MNIQKNNLKVSSSDLVDCAATQYEVELRFAMQWTVDDITCAQKGTDWCSQEAVDTFVQQLDREAYDEVRQRIVDLYAYVRPFLATYPSATCVEKFEKLYENALSAAALKLVESTPK